MKKLICLILTAMLLITGAVIIPINAAELDVTPPADSVTGDYVAPKFIGIQTRDNGDETQDIRFVATVASTKGNLLGFDVYANGKTYNFEGSTVYTQINAGDKTFQASDEGAAALFVVVIEDVPTGLFKVQFDVRTYVQYGEENTEVRSYNTTFEMNGKAFQKNLTAPTLAWATQGGTGTADNPYVLTQANFDAFYKAYSGQHIGSIYYSMESNVTLEWTEAVKPIGNFNGHFNGNGNTLSGLKISGTNYVGMFTTVHDGASISNLRLTDSTITCTASSYQYDRAGAVAGNLQTGATISNCYVNATVSATGTSANTSAGGIVGMLNGNTATQIKNCQFYGTVTCTSGNAGGIVGKTNSGSPGHTVIDCTFGGTATGNIAGYIFGKLESNDIQIKDCVIDQTAGKGTVTTVTGTTNTEGLSGVIGHVSGNTYTITNVTVTVGDNSYNAYIGKGYDLTSQYTMIKTLSNFYGFTSAGEMIPWVQGGCTDGTYYYYFMITNDSVTPTKCVILKYDHATQKLISTSNELTLGHANDAAYNPHNNTIVVAEGGSSYHVIDPDTLTVKNTVTMSSGWAISYNPQDRVYIIADNSKFYIHNENFEYQKSMTIPGGMLSDFESGGNMGSQGLTSDDKYIYYLEYWQNQSNQKDIRCNIAVFDIHTGALIDRVPLHMGREVENIIIWNNSFYIVCNNITWSGAECYRVDVLPEGCSIPDKDEPVSQYSWATQGGNGTAETPYIINQQNFIAFYQYYQWGNWNGFFDANEHFKLGSDIVVNTGRAEDWATTSPQTVFNRPLNSFVGTFDGNGYTISGLYIKTKNARAALFHEVNGGTVQNLRVTNSYFEVDSTDYDSAAAIAGRLNGGMIKGCYSDAIIKCNTSGLTNVMLGGIVGMVGANNSEIVNCQFAGTVTGNWCIAGGIVGKVNTNITGTKITSCTNNGEISVTGTKGDIIGKDQGSGTVIL
ncbi:MAG: hypothetical protein J6B71_00885 [Clostridia bacterium]|nr:hypothetical protein [Clostridia bacterium]